MSAEYRLARLLARPSQDIRTIPLFPQAALQGVAVPQTLRAEGLSPSTLSNLLHQASAPHQHAANEAAAATWLSLNETLAQGKVIEHTEMTEEIAQMHANRRLNSPAVNASTAALLQSLDAEAIANFDVGLLNAMRHARKLLTSADTALQTRLDDAVAMARYNSSSALEKALATLAHNTLEAVLATEALT